MPRLKKVRDPVLVVPPAEPKEVEAVEAEVPATALARRALVQARKERLAAERAAEEAEVPAEVPVVPTGPPCALEEAPVGAKIVVVREIGVRHPIPLLTTTAGPVRLAEDDLAHRLPEGAKIRKVGPTRYEAIQLNPVLDRPTLVTTNARAAITEFNVHFHDARS